MRLHLVKAALALLLTASVIGPASASTCGEILRQVHANFSQIQASLGQFESNGADLDAVTFSSLTALREGTLAQLDGFDGHDCSFIENLDFEALRRSLLGGSKAHGGFSKLSGSGIEQGAGGFSKFAGGVSKGFRSAPLVADAMTKSQTAGSDDVNQILENLDSPSLADFATASTTDRSAAFPSGRSDLARRAPLTDVLGGRSVAIRERFEKLRNAEFGTSRASGLQLEIVGGEKNWNDLWDGVSRGRISASDIQWFTDAVQVKILPPSPMHTVRSADCIHLETNLSFRRIRAENLLESQVSRIAYWALKRISSPGADQSAIAKNFASALTDQLLAANASMRQIYSVPEWIQCGGSVPSMIHFEFAP